MGRKTQTGVVVGATFLGVASALVGTRLLFQQQAAIARARIGKPLGEESLNADRVWRKSLEGDPISMLLLGDSLAAGLGAKKRKQTLGGRIAKGLARETGRPVSLHTAAVVGSESHELAGQLDALPHGYRADVAVVVVGGNDVTHLIPSADAAQHLENAINRLHDAGIAVVVGTCPDLGSLRPVPQPLRSVLSLMSRRMAAAQTRVVIRSGATPVSLRHTVGPIFRNAPNKMFSLDRFHPSAAGYRRTADALLPAVMSAVGMRFVRGEVTHTFAIAPLE